MTMVMLGLYRDNGKENGSYYIIGFYRGNIIIIVSILIISTIFIVLMNIILLILWFIFISKK